MWGSEMRRRADDAQMQRCKMRRSEIKSKTQNVASSENFYTETLRTNASTHTHAFPHGYFFLLHMPPAALSPTHLPNCSSSSRSTGLNSDSPDQSWSCRKLTCNDRKCMCRWCMRTLDITSSRLRTNKDRWTDGFCSKSCCKKSRTNVWGAMCFRLVRKHKSRLEPRTV